MYIYTNACKEEMHLWITILRTHLLVLSSNLLSYCYHIKHCPGAWRYRFLGSWNAYPGRNEGEIKSTYIHTHITHMFISFTPMQERHLMLLPWLINSGVEIVFGILFALAGMIISPFESGSILALLVLGESFHFNRKCKIKKIKWNSNQTNTLAFNESTQSFIWVYNIFIF